jgi:hypothetical protein
MYIVRESRYPSGRPSFLTNLSKIKYPSKKERAQRTPQYLIERGPKEKISGSTFHIIWMIIIVITFESKDFEKN